MNERDIQRALYPRVSDILSKQNYAELKNVPLETLANACIRGKKVHDYCTTMMKGLWCSDIEPIYEPYVDAFLDWSGKNVSETLHSLIRLYDDDLRFSGEFDMIVKMKESKEIALIDIKTSSAPSKTWVLQLAAYKHLCELNGYKLESIRNIHIKQTKPAVYEEKEGEKVLVSPPQVKLTDREYDPKELIAAWEIFSSALKCYDYFDRKEAK